MADSIKAPPPYAIASVDNALRIAAMLQLEGPLTVREIARRIGCAPSTAHRLLQMLLYRDFATQDDDRAYRVGPVLELATHSQSLASKLRAAALPHLRHLVDVFDESANLSIRAGNTIRFIASIESGRALRVGNREGMVFPAHLTSGGLALLAELDEEQLAELYAPQRYPDRPAERPDPEQLRHELDKVRRNGFAVNQGRSERGVVAVGVPVRGPGQLAVAGLSVSMPSVRYDKHQLQTYVATLRSHAEALHHDLQ